MLLRLHIRNLILVNECELSFHSDFNVITGETGSGKSVILSAIGLLTGDRADSELVRLGEEKAIVEGVFSTRKIFTTVDPELHELFQEYSLDDIFESPEITLKREITAQGKSKAFINGITVPVSLLKKIGEKAIEFSTQHAYMVMKDDSFGLTMLDSMIPEMPDLIEKYTKAFHDHKKILQSIHKLSTDIERKDLETEKLQEDIAMIEASHILETNAEELFREYSSLEERKSMYEIYSNASDILEGSPGKPSPLTLVQSLKSFLERSIKEFPDNKGDLLQHISSAHAELTEASFLIKKLLSIHEIDTTSLELYEAKLMKIEKVEKRWGRDREHIALALSKMKKRLSELSLIDFELEAAQAELVQTESCIQTLSEEIHLKRSQFAKTIQVQIEKELHELNMSSCKFEIEVTKTDRSITGISQVTLYITPNVGEKRVTLSDGASGGEMARVFLAIQTVSSSLQKIPTIIFDEVDANIGGVTAFHVGKKLSEIGLSRQVIAITHFPQVAEQASQHFSIRKVEEEGRTYTIVEALQHGLERETERRRMVGSQPA